MDYHISGKTFIVNLDLKENLFDFIETITINFKLIKRRIIMSTHEQLEAAVAAYIAESAAFETKGNKAAATRARKALGDIGKLTKVRRGEIQDKKNAM